CRAFPCRLVSRVGAWRHLFAQKDRNCLDCAALRARCAERARGCLYGPPASAGAPRRGGGMAPELTTMSVSQAYRAPFAPGQESAVDAALCERLLGVALSKGGDYADLFFEYLAWGGFTFDEGILKTASRGVSMGVGVRVQRGDATGYAYTEELTWDAMKRAAETAAQIATGGGGTHQNRSRPPPPPPRPPLPRPSAAT